MLAPDKQVAGEPVAGVVVGRKVGARGPTGGSFAAAGRGPVGMKTGAGDCCRAGEALQVVGRNIHPVHFSFIKFLNRIEIFNCKIQLWVEL